MEGLGTPFPLVGFKGTWDRGGFGPKATAAGVDPASGAASGREAVPANHVRQRWESSAGSYGAGFTKRERERTEAKEINPTARTGERCSASQYVNKYTISILSCMQSLTLRESAA